MIQSIRTSGKRKRKDDDGLEDDFGNDFNGMNDSSNEMHPTMGGGGGKSYRSYADSPIDLQALQVNTLRRYKKFYRIPTKPGLNKNQLAEVSRSKSCNSSN